MPGPIGKFLSFENRGMGDSEKPANWAWTVKPPQYLVFTPLILVNSQGLGKRAGMGVWRTKGESRVGPTALSRLKMALGVFRTAVADG